ncbi:MAG TPA: hypothetical protein VFE37_03390 [Chloroflexota bacterium]|nr:hypothetical protein [Chloroflexota bacterium]
MCRRLPQMLFYAVLGASALAVVLAGAMVCLQEPQVRALVLTYLR